MSYGRAGHAGRAAKLRPRRTYFGATCAAGWIRRAGGQVETTADLFRSHLRSRLAAGAGYWVCARVGRALGEAVKAAVTESADARCCMHSDALYSSKPGHGAALRPGFDVNCAHPLGTGQAREVRALVAAGPAGSPGAIYSHPQPSPARSGPRAALSAKGQFNPASWAANYIASATALTLLSQRIASDPVPPLQASIV